jgi:hypothetical protein
METIKAPNPIYLPLGQPKLNNYICITKGMYILFGGMPGSGKTAIVDSVFVIDLFDWWLENRDKVDVKPRWIYRSMERGEKYKRAKWLSYKLYKDHKILIDVPTIFQWSNKLYELSPKLIALMESYDKYFDELFEYVDLVPGATNPTGVYKYVRDYMEGKETSPGVRSGGKGKVIRENEHKRRFVYDDPNEIIFHVTDHIGKERGETGHYGDKQILDKHSSYMADECRDFYDMVPIDVSQLNRSIEDTYRGQKTELDIQPKDFKGSADPYENADIVIGLINPYKLGVDTYAGYEIGRFVTNKGYNRFRGLKIIKNSYGIDDFSIGYNFIGENGMMRELPRGDRMSVLEHESEEDMPPTFSPFDWYAYATNIEDKISEWSR